MHTILLCALSLAMDAFAVGLSFIFVGVSVLQSVIVIGLVSFVLSIVGLIFGTRLSQAFGMRMDVAIILIFIRR